MSAHPEHPDDNSSISATKPLTPSGLVEMRRGSEILVGDSNGTLEFRAKLLRAVKVACGLRGGQPPDNPSVGAMARDLLASGETSLSGDSILAVRGIGWVNLTRPRSRVAMPQPIRGDLTVYGNVTGALMGLYPDIFPVDISDTPRKVPVEYGPMLELGSVSLCDEAGIDQLKPEFVSICVPLVARDLHFYNTQLQA